MVSCVYNRAGGLRPRVHICQTHLWTLVAGQDCKKKDFTQARVDRLAERWLSTKALGYDVFQCSIWVIPINNRGNKHWVYVVVDFDARTIVYVDSYLRSLRDGVTAPEVTMVSTLLFSIHERAHIQEPTRYIIAWIKAWGGGLACHERAWNQSQWLDLVHK
jgi:hypothetical protein